MKAADQARAIGESQLLPGLLRSPRTRHRILNVARRSGRHVADDFIICRIPNFDSFSLDGYEL